MKIHNYCLFNKHWLVLLFILMPSLMFAQRTFVHPGLSHKKSDMERMRYMVQAHIEPWYSSYKKLLEDPHGGYDYEVKGRSTMNTVTQDGANYRAFSSDVKAAYLNAILWAVSQDKRYADKDVEIFNAWSNLTEFTGGGTESLNAGRVIWQLVEAAEIIKSTYNGWSLNDIQRFKNMLVYPGYSNIGLPTTLNQHNGTFYWRMYNGDPSRHGNQDLFGWRGVMAIGIFTDNEIMYDRALRYFKGLSHRVDDIPYQSGPPIVSAKPIATYPEFDEYKQIGYQSTIPDYGYNGVLTNYIWENGQSQEISRDQNHGILGIGMAASIAEMAWNQGDDVYSLFNNRILKGYEFSLHYNVSYNYSFPDQKKPWEPSVQSGEFIQRRDRTGRWFSKMPNPYSSNDKSKVTRGNFKSNQRPIYEMALAHYGVRLGLPVDSMKWTKRALDISNKETGYEQSGWSLDHLGWGGLTFHRPEGCAGDPCYFVDGKPIFSIPVLPGKVEAENFDFFAGKAAGRTCHDLSAGNSSGKYRHDTDVDIDTCSKGGYQVVNIESGEWLTYTIEVPKAGFYKIKVRYASNSGNGKIKFLFNNQVLIEDVNIPFGGNNSTGLTDLKDFTVASKVKLSSGVQSMRVYFNGKSGSFNLDYIEIVNSVSSFSSKL
ncbi:MAG: carbohydrate-binding protein [Paludibacter sp.]|nr:carbohydrate-binding protein [Paludibacter sp.]